MIKAVVFDVGGVLHTHDVRKIYDDAADYFGISRDDVASEYETLLPLLGSGKISEDDFWKQFKQDFNLKKQLPGESILVMGLRTTFRRNHDIFKYIRELQARGLKVAALSNTIKAHVDYLKMELIYEGFDEVVLSNEVGLQKPSPEIYQLALSRLRVSADEAVFVDDREINTVAAEALGISSIIYKSIEQLKWTLEALVNERR
jgi:epoxide hydrolase-like predicted phosphatase